MAPVTSVNTTSIRTAGLSSFSMSILLYRNPIYRNPKIWANPKLRQSQRCQDHVDDLDPDERRDDATDTIDPEVVTQQRGGADRSIFHAFERERDQRDDDQRIEDHG